MNTLFVCIRVCVSEGEVVCSLFGFVLVFMLASVLALVFGHLVSFSKRARVPALAPGAFVLVLLLLLARVANSNEYRPILHLLLPTTIKEDMGPGEDLHLVHSYPSRGRVG
jgi:hypothetical protein